MIDDVIDFFVLVAEALGQGCISYYHLGEWEEIYVSPLDYSWIITSVWRG